MPSLTGIRVFHRNAYKCNNLVRKTFCRYREKGVSAYDIEQMEDMLKLKNAKTSTRERLAKTLRKLAFL